MSTRATKRKQARQPQWVCLKCGQPTKLGFLDTGSQNGGPSTQTYVFSSCCLAGVRNDPHP